MPLIQDLTIAKSLVRNVVIDEKNKMIIVTTMDNAKEYIPYQSLQSDYNETDTTKLSYVNDKPEEKNNLSELANKFDWTTSNGTGSVMDELGSVVEFQNENDGTFSYEEYVNDRVYCAGSVVWHNGSLYSSFRTSKSALTPNNMSGTWKVINALDFVERICPLIPSKMSAIITASSSVPELLKLSSLFNLVYFFNISYKEYTSTYNLEPYPPEKVKDLFVRYTNDDDTDFRIEGGMGIVSPATQFMLMKSDTDQKILNSLSGDLVVDTYELDSIVYDGTRTPFKFSIKAFSSISTSIVDVYSLVFDGSSIVETIRGTQDALNPLDNEVVSTLLFEEVKVAQLNFTNMDNLERVSVEIEMYVGASPEASKKLAILELRNFEIQYV